MAKFSMGQTVVTRGVNDKVAEDTAFAKFVLEALRRHAAGDWGNLTADDKKANDQGLKHGDRLLSAYEQPGLPKIWVITECDRSATTVLFPEEY